MSRLKQIDPRKEAGHRSMRTWCGALVLAIGLTVAGHARPATPTIVIDPARMAVDASAELERVLDEVIQRNADRWPSGGIVIEVPPGRWTLSRPLRLDAKRSGRSGAPVVLRGSAEAATVLTGAVALEPALGLPPSLLARLSPSAREFTRAYRLPAGGASLLPTLRARQGQGIDPTPLGGEPFYPGGALTLARWPNEAYARTVTVPEDRTRIGVPPASVHWEAWSRAPDLWVHGYWGQDWADEWIPAQATESNRGELTFKGNPPKYGLRAGAAFRVHNVLEELDEPGEWYADASSELILIWPLAGMWDQTPWMTRLETVIDIRGASHVHLNRLHVEGARGDAVVVAGGREVILSRCVITHAGLRAVRLSGLAHGLLDSDIRDAGQGGAVLWGGDRQTLEPSRIQAVGNRFFNFNRWARTYRPALLVGGVGQVVRRNLVEGGPHTGLMFYGNDHLISENVLRDLATETGDVGAIYTGMDWTARGTVIRHNVLQDIRGPGLHGSRGIYLDDQASGITVQGNVFVRVDQAVFLGGGKDNLVDGNLFVASAPAIHLDDRGLTWQRNQALAPDGVLRRRLEEVPWRGPAYARYPGLSALLERDPGLPSGNVARRNAVMDGESFHFQGSAKSMLQVDRLFRAGELRFNAGPPLTLRDYGLLEPAADSPAVRDGFPLLPWNRMRCTRARWQGVPPGGVPRDDVAECREAAR
jgi:hypothetical protein